MLAEIFRHIFMHINYYLVIFSIYMNIYITPAICAMAKTLRVVARHEHSVSTLEWWEHEC
jgi:hypothetical protein